MGQAAHGMDAAVWNIMVLFADACYYTHGETVSRAPLIAYMLNPLATP